MVNWLAFCEARIAMIAIVKSQGHHISWRQPETLGDPGSNFGLDLPTYPTCKQGLKGQKFSMCSPWEEYTRMMTPQFSAYRLFGVPWFPCGTWDFNTVGLWQPKHPLVLGCF